MKQLLLILLFIPLISASTIQLDYPQEASPENITFSLELNDFPSGTYDVKIDIIQNDKRISKIWDTKWKSSMYYINDIITSNQSQEFLLTTIDALGTADITVKVRDSKNKVLVFDNYTIELTEKINQPTPPQSLEPPQESESQSKNSNTQSPKREPKQTNFIKKEFIPQVSKPIQLNPKTIKTEKSSQKVKKGYAKYSIFGFCILLFAIYKIKPKKKQNEFGNKETKNQFNYDY